MMNRGIDTELGNTAHPARVSRGPFGRMGRIAVWGAIGVATFLVLLAGGSQALADDDHEYHAMTGSKETHSLLGWTLDKPGCVIVRRMVNPNGRAQMDVSYQDLTAAKDEDKHKDICSSAPEEDGFEGTPCPSRPEAVKNMAPVKALRLVKAGRAPKGMKGLVEQRGKRLHFMVQAGAKRIPLGDVALASTGLPFKVQHQLKGVEWDPKGRALAFRVRITHDRYTFTDAWYPYLLPAASVAGPQVAPSPAAATSGSGVPDCDRFFVLMQCMLDHMTPEQRSSKDGRDAAKGLAEMRKQVPTLTTAKERAEIAQVCRETSAEVKTAIRGQAQFRSCLK